MLRAAASGGVPVVVVFLGLIECDCVDLNLWITACDARPGRLIWCSAMHLVICSCVWWTDRACQE